MTHGYTHAGLEWREKMLWTADVERPNEMHILLYNDDEDKITAADDLEDITTEPDDGNYERATLLLGTGSDIDVTPPAGDSEFPETEPVTAELGEVEFDVTDTSGVVDSWGAVLEFETEDDDSRRDHLVIRGQLDQTIDLHDWSGTQTLEGAVLHSKSRLFTTPD
jgi:hypothetical protein